MKDTTPIIERKTLLARSLFSMKEVIQRSYDSRTPLERNLYVDSGEPNDHSIVPSDIFFEDAVPIHSLKVNTKKELSALLKPKKPVNISEELTKMIFERDLEGVKSLLQSLFDESLLDKKDHRGYTPLILACKLSDNDPSKYYEIVFSLLEAGADPRIKDPDGWTAFEEAVMRQQVKISSIIYDYTSAYKLRTLTIQQDHLEAALRALPDYEIHIHWDFDSSIIPLISSLAPSDTFKITKIGGSIRLDSTIAGYSNLMTKRRATCSLLITNKPSYSIHITVRSTKWEVISLGTL